jgi:hypothetical protein
MNPVPALGSTNDPSISPHLDACLDDHLQGIRSQILREAKYLASRSKRDQVAPLDVAEAAGKFAPGKRFPAEPPFWQRIGSSLSAITLVSAALAALFALIGVVLNWQTGGAQAGSSGYFDIAKIFAGAIVGSSGANLVVTSRQS